MNSRRWEDMPPEFEYFLQQHRHYRFDIIGLTQSIKRADTVMRELVQFFFRIYKVAVIKIPFLGTWGLFFRREYDPDSIESGTRNYEGVGFNFPIPIIVDPAVFKMYDTYQKFPSFKREGTIEHHTYVNEPVMSFKRRLYKKTQRAERAPSLSILMLQRTPYMH